LSRIRRENRGRVVCRHFAKRRIAQHTSREELTRRLEVEHRDQRRQLIEWTVIRDLDGVVWPKLAEEVSVSREQDAVFHIGQPDERRVVERGIIERVVAKHAKPPCEAPEHGVGDKPR
jgi:hypothetical protein